jgi:hypothetical protein
VLKSLLTCEECVVERIRTETTGSVRCRAVPNSQRDDIQELEPGT